MGFRGSSIFLSLWPHRRADDGPGVLARGMWIGDFDDKLARKEPFYPHEPCGGVYSSYVRLCRKQQIAGLPFWPVDKLQEAPCFGVITLAAQDVPRCGSFDPELLRQKVRCVLSVAAAHGHDALVLGAFGCGYFSNPSEVVAKTFSELLHNEFASVFSAVLFAIPTAASMHEFSQLFQLTPLK